MVPAALVARVLDRYNLYFLLVVSMVLIVWVSSQEGVFELTITMELPGFTEILNVVSTEM